MGLKFKTSWGTKGASTCLFAGRMKSSIVGDHFADPSTQAGKVLHVFIIWLESVCLLSLRLISYSYNDETC